MDAFSLRLSAACLMVLPGLASAHGGDESEAINLFEPLLVVLLTLCALLYALGASNLWRKAGRGRGVSRTNALCFFLGWCVLVAALVSPLDALGARFFSAHMVQHELLMVVAAPLLLLGRPLEAWTWALPPSARRILGDTFRSGWISKVWDGANTALAAWVLHACALWVWHLPRLFDAAVTSELLHAGQHLCFLGTALLFWSVMFHGGTQRGPHPLCVLGLFTTMAHSGALGALLTFAPAPWYNAYAVHGPNGAIDALGDQQLGGLIMWVPGSFAYLIAGLYLAGRWLVRPRASARFR